MKYLLILMFFILGMPFIFADTIGETTITIKIYNNTIEITNSDFSGNDRTETFEILNKTNFSVISDHLVKYKTFSFPLYFVKNESIDLSVVEQYTKCLSDKSDCEIEKGKLDISYTKCNVELSEYEGENSTKCGDELDTCNLEIRQKDLDLGAKNTEITNLEDEKENTKNSKYFWGIGGIIAGIIGFLVYRGELGRERPKDGSVDEFNRNQAG